MAEDRTRYGSDSSDTRGLVPEMMRGNNVGKNM